MVNMFFDNQGPKKPKPSKHHTNLNTVINESFRN